MPILTQTNFFRFKGFQPERRPLTIEPRRGVVGAREFALVKNIEEPHDWRKKVEWAKKMHFHVCMNTPELAVKKPPLDENGQPDYGAIDALRQELKNPGLGLVHTGDQFHMTDDRQTHWVSFLNLDSVDDFEQGMGDVPFDPRRLRMEVWFKGHPAWDELRLDGGYPGTRPVRVEGKYRGLVRDVLTRCGAIQAEPDTGLRSRFNYLRALKECQDARGYVPPPKDGKSREGMSVMGILVEMLDPCVLAPGMELRFEA